jgi:ribokinase
VVDTTGAGDSFIGSLAVLLAEGKGVEDALKGAHVVAGWSVQRFGTQPSFAFRKDVAHIF